MNSSYHTGSPFLRVLGSGWLVCLACVVTPASRAELLTLPDFWSPKASGSEAFLSAETGLVLFLWAGAVEATTALIRDQGTEIHKDTHTADGCSFCASLEQPQSRSLNGTEGAGAVVAQLVRCLLCSRGDESLVTGAHIEFLAQGVCVQSQ